MTHVAYVRQKEALGFGHAVLMARDLVGDEPFGVMLADDIIDADVPCLKQMIEVYNETGCSVLATQVVEGSAISAYGVLDAKPVTGNWQWPALRNERTWWKSLSWRMLRRIWLSSAGTF